MLSVPCGDNFVAVNLEGISFAVSNLSDSILLISSALNAASL